MPSTRCDIPTRVGRVPSRGAWSQSELHFVLDFVLLPSMKANASSSNAIHNFSISRRRFLQTASASLALSALGADALDIVNGKPKRVGLIGAGWYGKSDLWRLVQVAPVEIISICDPDKHMLAEAVEIASQRQKSKKKPRTYGDYREMLKEKDLDIVLVGSPDHWH